MTKATGDEGVLDVIVIGGGIAGLTAAHWLSLNAKSFVVLEARGRLGGRVETDSKGADMDLGAAYFGPLQSYTMRYCEMFELGRIDNDLAKDIDHVIEWRDGTIRTFRNDSFPKDPLEELLESFGLLAGFFDSGELKGDVAAKDDLIKNIAKLEGLALRLRSDLNAPWTDRQARELDSLSVADWMDMNVETNSVRDLLTVGVRAALSTEPEDLSMLYLAYYTATGGSFVNVMAVGGGADSYRFQKGANALPDAFKGYISHMGAGTIRTGARVIEIVQGADTVTAVTDQGSFTGRRCIVAMSPTLSSRIKIPELPEARTRLSESMRMGRTIKGFLRFRSPWWSAREDKRLRRSGYALSAKGPVVWTMNNTWAVGDETKYSLMAFIVGKHADELALKTPDERKEAIINHWGTIFSVHPDRIREQLIETEPYREGVWGTGAWSGGCPAAFFPRGTFVEHGPALREPWNRVHWAGAETGIDWVGGYINGAIQSGIRAAEEVLKKLP